MQVALDEAVKTLMGRGCVSSEHESCLRLCMEEALVNAIHHGNQDRPEAIVRLEISADDKKCMVKVFDEGNGFCPEAVSPSAGDEEGGRGVCIMRHYTDYIGYNAEEGCLEMRFSGKGCREKGHAQ